MNLQETRQTAECPACQHPVEFSLSDVMRGASVLCGGCGKSIHLVDSNDSVKNSVKRIDEALSNLPKSITINLG